jgi:hypothetical protein
MTPYPRKPDAAMAAAGTVKTLKNTNMKSWVRNALPTRAAATSTHRAARRAAFASVRAGVLVCSVAIGATATGSATVGAAGISAVTAASSV